MKIINMELKKLVQYHEEKLAENIQLVENAIAKKQYYNHWQDAFVVFIEQYGHNYQDSYNLAVEFEMHLRKNRLGCFYLLENLS